MTNTTHVKYQTSDIAYLAGIIDGEGTFNIYKSHSRKYVARVYVVNTHYPLIEWLSKTFGGLTYIRKHAKWKTRYEWVYEKAKIIDLCQMLLPHLKIKKKQAEIMIKFRETIDPKRNRIPPELLSIRESLYLQLKLLNSRSS